jgi:phosphoglycolate phosphatase
MKQAVIFDLDGTLLNTIEDIHEAVNASLTIHGFDQIDIDITTSNIGHGAFNLIRQILIDENIDTVSKVYTSYQAYYDEHLIIHTKPYEGIELIIKDLILKGIDIGVVSNKHAYLVKELVNHFFKDIKHVKGMKPNVRMKPDPEMLLEIIDEMSLTHSDVYFVGDSEADILCAKASKVDVIAVSYGYRSKDKLLSLNPDVVLDSVDALYNYLKERV